MLETSVRAGECGPLIVLSGAAEFSNITQLIDVISSQLSEGVRQVVIDTSGLRFADSTSLWFLVLTARIVKTQGGSMVLIRPQPAVVRVLNKVDVEQIITVRTGTS